VLSTSKYTKIRFWPGLRPDPAGGAYDAPPDPIVGWGGGHALPIAIPLDAFGVSIRAKPASAPLALENFLMNQMAKESGPVLEQKFSVLEPGPILSSFDS